MKIGCILLAFAVCFSLFGVVCADYPVTGKAVNQKSEVSVFILPSLPQINIILPENKTYITNNSLFLNYTFQLADNLWYSINSGINISLSGNTRINVSEGVNVLFLYGNNSGGVSSKNTTFFVNSSLLTILYDSYKDGYGGLTPNFIYEAYEDLLNYSDLCFEDIRYGKICFLKPINIISDENPYDYLVDLDKNTNISFDKAGLNSSALPNLNKSARIWLYNLSFVNPMILRDGIPCPSNECLKESYLHGTLIFVVKSFSFYSAVESPEGISEGGGGIPSKLCRGVWNCTEWGECINKTQERTCTISQENCIVSYEKPSESKACEEKAALPEKETVIKILINLVCIREKCCLLGVCGFRWVLCWYWWVLIILIIAEIVRRQTKNKKLPQKSKGKSH